MTYSYTLYCELCGKELETQKFNTHRENFDQDKIEDRGSLKEVSSSFLRELEKEGKTHHITGLRNRRDVVIKD